MTAWGTAELRIGNLIRHKTMNMFRVDQLHLTDHQGYVARMYFNNDLESYFDLEVSLAEPIPLTEEILLKCGFQPKYFGIKTYYSPLMELDHDFHLMGVDYGVKIKHLHQLQNLYFALTGKELEVKLWQLKEY